MRRAAAVAVLALLLAAGCAGARFTHTFEDPRFPGMRFPSTGVVQGVPSTPIERGK